MYNHSEQCLARGDPSVMSDAPVIMVITLYSYHPPHTLEYHRVSLRAWDPPGPRPRQPGGRATSASPMSW